MPVATTPQVFPRRWAIVGLLFTASLINYFDRATISFALPLISTELHLGPEAKGLLLSAFFWSYTLMQIPMGVLADRVNLRWLYAAAFTLWSMSQGLMGLATGLGTLIVFRMLLGIGESIYLPGGSKIVSLLFRPAERGLPCGIFDAGTRTGLVIEGVLVPLMLTHYGWRTTFMVVGFAALVWLLPWFCYAAAAARAHRAHRPPLVRGFVTAVVTLRHEPQSARRLPRLLLLRLLLVFPRQLAARLPGDRAGPDDHDRRHLRGAAVLRVRGERADWRLDCRSVDRSGWSETRVRKADRHHRVPDGAASCSRGARHHAGHGRGAHHRRAASSVWRPATSW